MAHGFKWAATYVGLGNSSTGLIQFGSSGGTLTSLSLLAAPSQIAGTGTINTSGLIVDGNLVFDAAHGPVQTVNWTSATQNVAVTIDLSGAGGAPALFGAGNQGYGSVTIQDGLAISDAFGYLGYRADSSGVVTIAGTGSAWNLTDTNLFTIYLTSDRYL